MPHLGSPLIPRIFGVLLVLISAISSLGLSADEDSQTHIAFPAGYREWVRIKSTVVGPESPAYATEAGIHHIYANKIALVGFRTGVFDDGSIVVYDLLSFSEKAGIGSEGARRRTDVMVKNSKIYPATAGWGFGRFMGDDREHDILTPQVRQTCYQCHQSSKQQGFVFSQFHE